MDYRGAELWQRTFGDRADEHNEQRRSLEAAFLQMREAVVPVAADIALSVPNYTDHSIEHCDSLWETASQLVGPDYPLNPAEVFVLGCSFLVHDLGMGLAAYPDGLSGLIEDVEWLDFLSASDAGEADKLQAQLRSDVQANSTWDGLSSAAVKNYLTNYLRSRHAKQAEQIVKASWNMSDGSSVYLLADPLLRRFYGPVIGRIARSHWTDVSLLPETLPQELGPGPAFPIDWTVNSVKLACILRLADAINVDARRASPLHTPHRLPQGTSVEHWDFQERLLKPQIRDKRVYFTSGEGFDVDRSQAWWLAYDSVTLIDSELRRVDNLCADEGIPRMMAHGAAGAESPARFAKFVEPQGWKPIDARPFIGDPNLVMRQLGGASLYGRSASQEVALRELLANAIDASRALRGAFPEADEKPIQVTLRDTSDGEYIDVRDFGIGMHPDDMAQRLCNFGTSGWRDIETQSTLPGVLSSGYRPTGQFGIGFFAVFMVADEVSVISRHVEAGKDATSVLTFSDGLETRPLLRAAERKEQLLVPGTMVSFKLKEPTDSMYGLFRERVSSSTISSEEFIAYIRYLALTSDIDIDARLGESDPLGRAVSASEWLAIGADELFDSMNVFVDHARSDYLAVKKVFSLSARTVQDGHGKTIARLAFDLRSPSSIDPWLRSQAAYCGGLLSRLSSHDFYHGVIDGPPLSAARAEVSFTASRQAMLEWFSEQRQLAVEHGASAVGLLNVGMAAMALGVDTGDLPLAVANNGYTDREALVSRLAVAESFVILEGIARKYEFETDDLYIVESDYSQDFALIPDGAIVIADSRWDRSPLVRPSDDIGLSGTNVPTAQARRLETWWKMYELHPLGEIMRTIAAVWSFPLWAVAQAIDFRTVEVDGHDRRIEVDRFGGGNCKIDAWTISRNNIDSVIELINKA
jgi:hypothetical protein